MIRKRRLVLALALAVTPNGCSSRQLSSPAITSFPLNASCDDALDAIMDPAMERGLAIANDASSKVNIDAYKILNPTTGYPGPIGDYGECGKVELFTMMETHLCLAGSVSLNTSVGTTPFGGVCVPVQCEPEYLASEEFAESLERRLADLRARPATTPTQFAYLENLQAAAAVAAREFEGFTCGTYARPNFGADAWAVCALLALLCGVVTIATVLDLVRAPDYPEDIKDTPPRSPPGGGRYGPLKDHGSRPPGGISMNGGEGDHINKYWAAFSLPRNLSRLFQTSDRTELSAFEGLRVISMLWVVLGHILAVQASVGYTNPEAVFPPNGLVSQIIGQLFFSARFSVDTFFFVSGFLVVYVMLRRFGSQAAGSGDDNYGSNGSAMAGGGDGKRGGGSRSIGKLSEWLPFFYVHRLLRITPIYLICLLIWWKVAVFLGEGPFWYRWQYYITLCDNFWWTNMLYINNLIPWHAGETSECFYHTWYLANDMQFYIVSPIYIVLYMRHKFWGATAALGTLVASVAIMAWGTYARHWSALTLDGQWVVRYSQETYTAPWARIVPYMGGMIFAMIWDEKKRRWPRFKLTNPQRYIAGVSGCVILLGVTFAAHSAYLSPPCSVKQNPSMATCGSDWPMWLHMLYNAGTRPAWVVGLCLLCFLCFNNQGGLLQEFLEHRGWAPMARLSFGAYLLHPLVINLWFLNATAKFHFSKLDFVMIYICVSTATFGCSLLLSLLVEGPLTRMGKYLEQAMKPSSNKRARRERERNRGAGSVSLVFDAAAQSPGFLTHRVLPMSVGGSIDADGSVDVNGAGSGELAQLMSGNRPYFPYTSAPPAATESING